MSTPSTFEDGRFGRVRSIDNDLGRVFIDFASGFSTWFVPDDLDEWSPGDIGFITPSSSEKVDSSLWKHGRNVAEVRAVKGQEVVVSIDGTLHSYTQRDPARFEVGQVVRVEIDGELGPVVSDEPISAIRVEHSHDDFDVADLMFDATALDVTLDMVGGSDQIKRRARNLVRVALDPEDRIGQIGVNPVKGLLFSGPSGTGKTFLAKALAADAGATFYDISGPALEGELVGQAERRLRNLFDHAATNKPAILFFDELDSMFSRRGEGSNQHTNRLVGQFLARLDGIKAFPQVLVIATTNIPQVLDAALLRPGRLSHKLVFEVPDESDRYLILQAQAKRAKFANGDTAPIDQLVEMTPGWTAADLGAIWTEAGVLASLDRRRVLLGRDLVLAVGEVQRIQTSTAAGEDEG